MSSKPIPFKLSDDNLKRLIREAAADTRKVFTTPHAKKRMVERNITPTQIYSCLRQGRVTEPAHMNIHGNWQCTFTRRHAGDDVTVVAALERAENGDWVVIVTVY